jgi:tetratricopeptide (TPR) repeat protein
VIALARILVAALIFATGLLWPDDTIPSLPVASTTAVHARKLLRNGQIGDAERLIAEALRTQPDAEVWCAAGELRFRQGNFDRAREAFQNALQIDADHARSIWGLGRVEQIHFRPDAARAMFAKAFQRDARDPEIILSYLEYVSDRASRSILLQNVAVLSTGTDPRRAEDAVARLAIENRLGGKDTATLASDYTGYRIPLGEFHPSGSEPLGLLLTARINGGRPLRLLLDTGARTVLLHGSAARGLGLEPVVRSGLRGFGDRRPAEATLMLARSMAFGPLEFRDCPIEVSNDDLTPGADGIIGANLFERFLIRIDSRAHMLHLTPSEPGSGGDGPHAIGLDRLLLLQTHVEQGPGGWFLLDTGAAYTGLSPALSPPQLSMRSAQLAGMQGGASAFHLSPLELRVGRLALAERSPVSVDLSAISQREGVEISGILGYSTLRHEGLTIDFRSGVVRIGGN